MLVSINYPLHVVKNYFKKKLCSYNIATLKNRIIVIGNSRPVAIRASQNIMFSIFIILTSFQARRSQRYRRAILGKGLRGFCGSRLGYRIEAFFCKSIYALLSFRMAKTGNIVHRLDIFLLDL